VGAAVEEEVGVTGDAAGVSVGVMAEEVGAAARDAAGDAAEKGSAVTEGGGAVGVFPAAAEMAAGRMAGVGEVFGGEVVGSERGVTTA
jgi:hypothetical protein